jgi:hypothetical protein
VKCLTKLILYSVRKIFFHKYDKINFKNDEQLEKMTKFGQNPRNFVKKEIWPKKEMSPTNKEMSRKNVPKILILQPNS